MSDNDIGKETVPSIISQGVRWIAISVGVTILPIVITIGLKAFLGFKINISDYIDDITLVAFPISVSLLLLCIDRTKKMRLFCRKFNVIFSFLMAGLSIIFYVVLYFYLLGIISGENDSNNNGETLEKRFFYLCIYVLCFVVYTSIVGYRIEQRSSKESNK